MSTRKSSWLVSVVQATWLAGPDHVEGEAEVRERPNVEIGAPA